MEVHPEHPYLSTGTSWSWVEPALKIALTTFTTGALIYTLATSGCAESRKDHHEPRNTYRTIVTSPLLDQFYTDGPKVHITP